MAPRAVGRPDPELLSPLGRCRRACSVWGLAFPRQGGFPWKLAFANTGRPPPSPLGKMNMRFASMTRLSVRSVSGLRESLLLQILEERSVLQILRPSKAISIGFVLFLVGRREFQRLRFRGSLPSPLHPGELHRMPAVGSQVHKLPDSYSR